MTDTQTTEIEPSVLSRHAVRQSERSPISQKNQEMFTTVTKGFNLIHWASNVPRTTSAGLMLAHRLRRWANIKLALGQRLVFAG